MIADFDGDGKADNISFMIKRIKVHTSKALDRPGYRFPGNYGVEKFLEIFSGKNLSLYSDLFRHVLTIFQRKTMMHSAWPICLHIEISREAPLDWHGLVI